MEGMFLTTTIQMSLNKDVRAIYYGQSGDQKIEKITCSDLVFLFIIAYIKFLSFAKQDFRPFWKLGLS